MVRRRATHWPRAWLHTSRGPRREPVYPVPTVVRKQVDSAADRDAVLPRIDGDRRVQRLTQRTSDCLGGFAAWNVFEDDGELIAAETGHRIAGPYTTPMSAGHVPQDFVTGGVARVSLISLNR